MEMMEGYQGGNASAQMLSSLICTDNNKSRPEKSKVTKKVTKVTKLWKGKVVESHARGKSPVFFYW